MNGVKHFALVLITTIIVMSIIFLPIQEKEFEFETLSWNDSTYTIMVSNANGLLMFSTGQKTFGCRYTGEISDLRIWTRVLTKKEILEAYKQGLPKEKNILKRFWNWIKAL